MSILSFIITESNITIRINDKTKIINESHINFNAIKRAVEDKQYSILGDLINTNQFIETQMNGDVTVDDQGELCDSETDQPLHPSISKRILGGISHEAYDPTSLKIFMSNLNQNPSKDSQQELLGFLENCDLPITQDGHFLAYKRVRPDYKDYHSGTFDNSIGSVCEMVRDSVNANRNDHCSYGLHFCSYSYAAGFYSEGKLMIAKINPKDVVSIPTDYNFAKGRCCRYEVIGELEGNTKIPNYYWNGEE